MALRTCTVSVTGPSGLRHSIDVTAESVYEAAALAVAQLRRHRWVETVGRGMPLEVQVREIAATHIVSIAQIERRCDGVATSPDEVLKRKRVKTLIQQAI